MEVNRKKDIIKAAQEIFSTYGLADANISEIAKKAGIVDSIIYHYFKNKEDLLFYAVAEKMTFVKRDLNQHLEGIIDPASKIGKMVWFHLWINDANPTDSHALKNLLFECRANKDFYSHKGYLPLKKYVQIMHNLLQEGVDAQIFRNDFDLICEKHDFRVAG